MILPIKPILPATYRPYTNFTDQAVFYRQKKPIARLFFVALRIIPTALG
jgi:hypothetical protein